MWEYSYQINNLVLETAYKLEIIATFDQQNSSSKSIDFFTPTVNFVSSTISSVATLSDETIGEITNQQFENEITTDSVKFDSYLITKVSELFSESDFETDFVTDSRVLESTVETGDFETTRVFEENNLDSTMINDLVPFSSKPSCAMRFYRGISFVFITALFFI